MLPCCQKVKHIPYVRKHLEMARRESGSEIHIFSDRKDELFVSDAVQKELKFFVCMIFVQNCVFQKILSVF